MGVCASILILDGPGDDVRNRLSLVDCVCVELERLKRRVGGEDV